MHSSPNYNGSITPVLSTPTPGPDLLRMLPKRGCLAWPLFTFSGQTERTRINSGTVSLNKYWRSAHHESRSRLQTRIAVVGEYRSTLRRLAIFAERNCRFPTWQGQIAPLRLSEMLAVARPQPVASHNFTGTEVYHAGLDEGLLFGRHPLAPQLSLFACMPETLGAADEQQAICSFRT